MKEQLAKMTIIELVRTAHSYSTSIKQTGVYSELVREIASRLEALNLAHIGAMSALSSTEKDRDQLAAECAALKDAIQTHSESVHFCEVCGKDDPCSTDDVCYALKETPETDRFLAEQRAQGVEMFAAHIGDLANSMSTATAEKMKSIGRQGLKFAAQLRNEVKV